MTEPREEDVEALRKRALNLGLDGWERAQAVNELADRAIQLQREVDERLRVNVGLVAENSELKKKVGR